MDLYHFCHFHLIGSVLEQKCAQLNTMCWTCTSVPKSMLSFLGRCNQCSTEIIFSIGNASPLCIISKSHTKIIVLMRQMKVKEKQNITRSSWNQSLANSLSTFPPICYFPLDTSSFAILCVPFIFKLTPIYKLSCRITSNAPWNSDVGELLYSCQTGRIMAKILVHWLHTSFCTVYCFFLHLSFSVMLLITLSE